MPRRYLSFFLVLAFLVSPSYGKSISFDGSKTRVEFLAVGNPSALKIKGVMPEGDTDAIKGHLTLGAGDQFTGSAVCKLEKFGTGIALRDRHMKEKYLEVAKYPDAKLDITKLLANLNADEVKIKAAPFEGMLDLHGVKKNVTGVADLAKKGSKVNAYFELKLKVSDFAIASPSFMGITMADEVTVTVTTEGDLL